jgi:hypothetical protein
MSFQTASRQDLSYVAPEAAAASRLKRPPEAEDQRSHAVLSVVSFGFYGLSCILKILSSAFEGVTGCERESRDQNKNCVFHWMCLSMMYIDLNVCVAVKFPKDNVAFVSSPVDPGRVALQVASSKMLVLPLAISKSRHRFAQSTVAGRHFITSASTQMLGICLDHHLPAAI